MPLNCGDASIYTLLARRSFFDKNISKTYVMLTLKDFELIRAIAETGTLTDASEALHVTQSALSQRLKSLNARLDLNFAERKGGQMVLTAAGDRALVAAHAISREMRALRAELAALTQQRDGCFRITTQCYTCYRWLPFVISDMRNQFPMLTVDVVPEATDSPYQALAKGGVDVAVVSNPDKRSKRAHQPLFDDELFAIVHADHPFARRSYVLPRSFRGETLLLYTSNKHAIVEEVLRPAGVTGFDIVQVRITEAIVELARAGRGIAVIAGWAADDIERADGLVKVRIGKRGFSRTWQAVCGEAAVPAHVDGFVTSVRRIGNAIGRQHWRRSLERRISA